MFIRTYNHLYNLYNLSNVSNIYLSEKGDPYIRFHCNSSDDALSVISNIEDSIMDDDEIININEWVII